jgi:hypothetical protein
MPNQTNGMPHFFFTKQYPAKIFSPHKILFLATFPLKMAGMGVFLKEFD